MTERPILFSAPMVRALLAGTKTQTRRIVKPKPGGSTTINQDCETGQWGFHWYTTDDRGDPTIEHWKDLRCPYGVPGDTLWVREAWSPPWAWRNDKPRDIIPCAPIWYWADGEPTDGDWTKPKPSIHMPRWVSRISLRITDVRVERLNEISEADAKAEGIVQLEPPAHNGLRNFGVENMGSNFSPICHQPTAGRAYRFLWERINGAESWVSNPWVWAVSFERAA